MTFLPIVERELRVASRRKFTYWFRIITAGFALIISGSLLGMWSLEKGIAMGTTLGVVQFSILEWMTFIFACLSGIFLTSDSLSEEKREGTLGLLFLTDLRGHDVVLGKLCSHSLQAFYGLLASFPVLGLCMLMGGVTGEEFSRAILVVCNTLFFSLAVGLFVSSISREVLKAMNGALLINLLFLIGFPWIDSLIGYAQNKNNFLFFSEASPGYLFAMLKNMHTGDFWFRMGLQHGIGWLFLAGACFCVPRAWQEKASVTTGTRVSLMQRWRFGGASFRLALRRRLLSQGALLWLALRDRWTSRLSYVAMVIVMGLLGWAACSDFISPGPRAAYMDSRLFRYADSCAQLMSFVLFLWVAAQACRFFVESTRNGAMELILVTPVTPREIIMSQWKGICRTFLPVVIFIIALKAVSKVHFMLRVTLPGGAATSTVFGPHWLQIIGIILGNLSLVCNLAALAWFGMWMGLTTTRTATAVLKTLVFVVVLPWIGGYIVMIFGLLFTAFLMRGNPWSFRLVQHIPFVLDVVKSCFFIFWARGVMFQKLHIVVSRGGRLAVTPTPVAVAAPSWERFQ